MYVCMYTHTDIQITAVIPIERTSAAAEASRRTGGPAAVPAHGLGRTPIGSR